MPILLQMFDSLAGRAIVAVITFGMLSGSHGGPLWSAENCGKGTVTVKESGTKTPKTFDVKLTCDNIKKITRCELSFPTNDGAPGTGTVSIDAASAFDLNEFQSEGVRYTLSCGWYTEPTVWKMSTLDVKPPWIVEGRIAQCGMTVVYRQRYDNDVYFHVHIECNDLQTAVKKCAVFEPFKPTVQIAVVDDPEAKPDAAFQASSSQKFKITCRPRMAPYILKQ